MDALFAVRTKSGLYSRIFTSREEVENLVQQDGLGNVEVGLVTFLPLCRTRAEIEIPWDEGFGSLQSRHELVGVRAEESSPDVSSVPSESEPEVRSPKRSRKARS